MTRILRALVPVIAAVAIMVALPLGYAAAQQLPYDSIIKSLMSVGVAHPVSGKLLPGAIVDPTSVVGASLQSTDNTLNTVSLDDEMLYKVGRGMTIYAWGTLAANANAKDIKLKIGGTAICTITGNTGNNVDFAFFATVVEDGADSQRGFCWSSVNGALVAAASVNLPASTVDANVTMAIITTGNNTAAAASAATGKGLVVVPFGG